MRSTTSLLVLAAGMLSAPANALNLRKSNGQSKVVSLSTERKPVTDPVRRDRLRRRDTVTAELDNEVSTITDRLDQEPSFYLWLTSP